MKLIKSLLAASLLAGSLFAADYAFTPNRGKVGFTINHRAFGAIEGRFDKFDGTISIDGGKVTALKGTVEVVSISTENLKRDEHLKNADFFDEPKFPKIVFASTSASANTIAGNLTIHGITKPVTLNVKRDIESGRTGDNYLISGKIKRSDFDIGDSFTTNVQLDDEVTINLSIRPSI
ncbi:MAG: YceI family protein [Helicobacteraceae bacterium]|jgi:polyisoprenoid-binding protein YceI|nr:YceI family protein [Helicobacteraceae bacterium]